ncbi:hypothetical protein Celaphus_00017427 [Cervus elaphus hippelaphus]|uniref:Uncharacterized protein n=1 Tax=Cervus elaphus hippelaphus TaxID=46360 RepID=A0A212D5R4_CEREH|nr:hypothetical protein Celaphus_00017427 [Cervus elaphus hippelaphus]
MIQLITDPWERLSNHRLHCFHFRVYKIAMIFQGQSLPFLITPSQRRNGLGSLRIHLNKMKVLLLLTAILAITIGFPVSQDKEREAQSVSESDELSSQLFFPPHPYPRSHYSRFFCPWWTYFYPPIPVPASVSAATPLNEK